MAHGRGYYEAACMTWGNATVENDEPRSLKGI